MRLKCGLHLRNSSQKNSRHLLVLTLNTSHDVDSSFFMPLTRLRRLNLVSVDIMSIDCVADMHDLQVLSLQNTRISDLSTLKRISSLLKLDVSWSPVRDLLPVAHHRKMRYLDFSNCPVIDLSFLYKLTALEHLRCNQIQNGADFSPVASLINLQILILSFNRLGPLHFLTGLRSLSHLSQPHQLTLSHSGNSQAFNTYGWTEIASSSMLTPSGP